MASVPMLDALLGVRVRCAAAPRTLGAVLVVALFALVGCSGSDGGDTAPPPSTTTTVADEEPGLELSVDGDGFLLVRQGTDMLYTPAASFTLDTDGKLTTPDGALLTGWPANGRGTVETNGPVADLVVTEAAEIGEDGFVTDGGQALGQVAVATFATPDGLERVGGSLLRPTAESGLASVGIPGIAGRGSIAVGAE